MRLKTPPRPVIVLSLLVVSAVTACDADEVAKQCVAADLVGQCPVGSNPVLGAAANEGCDGKFTGNLVGADASVSGQCSSNGTCEFLCQFESPCTCGVETITRDAIVCSECPDQRCGDSMCEGTERASCEPNQPGCFVCLRPAAMEIAPAPSPRRTVRRIAPMRACLDPVSASG